MIIPYPTHLPKPLVSSAITPGEKFLSNNSLKNYLAERIIKKNDVLNLKFRYNLEEYIEFEDLYYYDIEAGKNTFSIVFFDDFGEIVNQEVDLFGDVNVSRVSNIFEVNFSVIVKRKL